MQKEGENMADTGTNVGTIGLKIDITQDLQGQIDNSAKGISSGLQSGIEKGLNIDGILKSFSANLDNHIKASMSSMQKATESSIDNIKSKAINSINEISSAVKNIPQPTIKGSVFSTPFNKSNNNKVSQQAQTTNFNPMTAQLDILSRKMDVFSGRAMNARQRVNELKAEIDKLSANTGNPIENKINTYTIERLKKELSEAQAEEEKFGIKSDSVNVKLQALTDKMNGGATATNRNAKAVRDKASSFGEASNKGSIFSTILSRLKGGTDAAAASTRQHSSTMDRLGLSFGQIGRMMDRMLIRMVIFNTLIKGLKSLGEYIGSALMTNAQFSASLQEIRSNLMTAFMPIYNACLPALNSLMSALANATSYIASFISQLFGTTYKASYNNASALQSQIGSLDMAEKQAKKTADSLGTVGGSAKKTSDAIKEAAAESKKGLAGFDEINKMGSETAAKVPKAGKPAGSGVIAPITPTANMAPIEAATAGWADKVRNILANLWKPFQQAWAAEGLNTINAAKYALSGIEDLIGSIAKSFYTVWTNGTGTKILTNMLKILQDVLNIVGDIGHTWANAWNNGNIGTQIVQDLANAFNNVLSLIDKVLKSVRKVFAEEGPTFAGLFMQTLKNTTHIIEDVTQKLGWIWDHGGQHAFEGLVKLGMKVGELAMTIYNQFVVPFVNWFINNISPVLAKALDGLGSIFDKASQFIDWLMGSGKPVLDVIVVAISSIVATIKTIETTKAIIKGVTDTFGKLKDGIETAYLKALDFKDGIVKVGSKLIDVGKNIADFGSDLAKIAWEKAATGASNLWNGLKNVGSAALDGAKALGTFILKIIEVGAQFAVTTVKTLAHVAALGLHKIATLASAAAEGVLKVAQAALNLVMNMSPIVWIVAIIGGLIIALVTLYNKCEWFRNGVNAIFTDIKDIFKDLINDMIYGINVLISGLDKLSFNIPDFLGGGHVGFNIGHIPYLAQGGIVDKATPFIAGEQGREAIMPLENNTGWINELAGKISTMIMPMQQPKLAFAPSGNISQNTGYSSSSSTSTSIKDEIKQAFIEAFKSLKDNGYMGDSNKDIILQVDETKLGKASIKAINNANRAAGKNLIR